MGSWHPDSKDDHTQDTLFVLLLKIGPSKLYFLSVILSTISHGQLFRG